MTTPTTPLHDSAWLDDVAKVGPNGVWFVNEPTDFLGDNVGVSASHFIMEDDTSASEFTPGCGAYAGYSAASDFYNMPEVRAYAAGQKAKVFAYTPTANDVVGANALDIEPGDASPSDAVTAYRKGIRYFYGSASWVSSITGVLTGAGFARSSYRIISAHYIGSHICGPGSCGYPQADATQFTDSYLGRSLDATLCPYNFLGTPPVPPVKPPTPTIFGPVRALKLLNDGPHSFKVSFYSPTSGPGPVVDYQIAVVKGKTLTGPDITDYPRVIPKGPASLVEWQGGGLLPGLWYTAGFRARGAAGSHAGRWASVTFKTPVA